MNERDREISNKKQEVSETESIDDDFYRQRDDKVDSDSDSNTGRVHDNGAGTPGDVDTCFSNDKDSEGIRDNYNDAILENEGDIDRDNDVRNYRDTESSQEKEIYVCNDSDSNGGREKDADIYCDTENGREIDNKENEGDDKVDCERNNDIYDNNHLEENLKRNWHNGNTTHLEVSKERDVDVTNHGKEAVGEISRGENEMNEKGNIERYNHLTIVSERKNNEGDGDNDKNFESGCETVVTNNNGNDRHLKVSKEKETGVTNSKDEVSCGRDDRDKEIEGKGNMGRYHDRAMGGEERKITDTDGHNPSDFKSRRETVDTNNNDNDAHLKVNKERENDVINSADEAVCGRDENITDGKGNRDTYHHLAIDSEEDRENVTDDNKSGRETGETSNQRDLECVSEGHNTTCSDRSDKGTQKKVDSFSSEKDITFRRETEDVDCEKHDEIQLVKDNDISSQHDGECYAVRLEDLCNNRDSQNDKCNASSKERGKSKNDRRNISFESNQESDPNAYYERNSEHIFERYNDFDRDKNPNEDTVRDNGVECAIDETVDRERDIGEASQSDGESDRKQNIDIKNIHGKNEKKKDTDVDSFRTEEVPRERDVNRSDIASNRTDTSGSVEITSKDETDRNSNVIENREGNKKRCNEGDLRGGEETYIRMGNNGDEDQDYESDMGSANDVTNKMGANKIETKYGICNDRGFDQNKQRNNEVSHNRETKTREERDTIINNKNGEEVDREKDTDCIGDVNDEVLGENGRPVDSIIHEDEKGRYVDVDKTRSKEVNITKSTYNRFVRDEELASGNDDSIHHEFENERAADIDKTEIQECEKETNDAIDNTKAGPKTDVGVFFEKSNGTVSTKSKNSVSLQEQIVPEPVDNNETNDHDPAVVKTHEKASENYICEDTDEKLFKTEIDHHSDSTKASSLQDTNFDKSGPGNSLMDNYCTGTTPTLLSREGQNGHARNMLENDYTEKRDDDKNYAVTKSNSASNDEENIPEASKAIRNLIKEINAPAQLFAMAKEKPLTPKEASNTADNMEVESIQSTCASNKELSIGDQNSSNLQMHDQSEIVTVGDIKSVTTNIVNTTFAKRESQFDNLEHIERIDRYIEENGISETEVSCVQKVPETNEVKVNEADVEATHGDPEPNDLRIKSENTTNTSYKNMAHSNQQRRETSTVNIGLEPEVGFSHSEKQEKEQKTKTAETKTYLNDLQIPKELSKQEMAGNKRLKFRSFKENFRTNARTTETLVCSNCLLPGVDTYSAGFCKECLKYLCHECVDVHTEDKDMSRHSILIPFCENELAVDKYVVATGYCLDCNYLFCMKCARGHTRLRQYRRHRIVQSSFASKPTSGTIETREFREGQTEVNTAQGVKVNDEAAKSKRRERTIYDSRYNPYRLSYHNVLPSLNQGSKTMSVSSYTSHPKWPKSSFPLLPYLVDPKPIGSHSMETLPPSQPSSVLQNYSCKLQKLKSAYGIQDDATTHQLKCGTSQTAQRSYKLDDDTLPEIHKSAKTVSATRRVKSYTTTHSKTLLKRIEYLEEHCLSISFPSEEKRTVIAGMDVLLNGRLIVLDSNNNGVKLYNRSFVCRAALQFRSRLVDITASNLCETDLYAATTRFIYEISAMRGMELKKKIKVEIRRIEGLTYWKYGLAVVCKQSSLTWELRLLDYRGNLKSRLEILNPLTFDIASSTLYHVATSKGGKCVVITDTQNSCIIAIDVITRKVVYETQLHDNVQPNYLSADEEHNVFVSCGNSVVQLTKNGDMMGKVLEMTTDLDTANCIVYNKFNNKLYVQTSGDCIAVYKVATKRYRNIRFQ